MEKIFQVSEFNEFINLYLGQMGEIVVEGEISEIRLSQNKWLFLTIKDKESSISIFGVANVLYGWKNLVEGMMIHVYGVPRLYKKSGRFSIFANRIVPAGEGALLLAFEKLKTRLESEGLFAPERKRTLPFFPQKIGLITARDSEAYYDFIKVLKARMGGIKIYFYPVNVQGKESVRSIENAFNYFNKNSSLDLLVLTRGGGSLEDLSSFNDEKVARCIFGSRIPVVCGVGHEGDITISDLVADLRASTPSNAAELIVRDRRDILREVNFNISSIVNNISRQINDKKSLISESMGAFINAISRQKTEVNLLSDQIAKNVTVWFDRNKSALESLSRLLGSLDYRRVLERGFSITYDSVGKIIKTTEGISNKSSITTTLFNGKIVSRVESIKKGIT